MNSGRSEVEIAAGGPGGAEPPRRLSGAHVQRELHGVAPGAMRERSAEASAVRRTRVKGEAIAQVPGAAGTTPDTNARRGARAGACRRRRPRARRCTANEPRRWPMPAKAARNGKRREPRNGVRGRLRDERRAKRARGTPPAHRGRPGETGRAGATRPVAGLRVRRPPSSPGCPSPSPCRRGWR